MTEYGSHITLNNLDKPSIFDIVSQDSLLENLHPAFEHAVTILTEKYPAKLSWLYKHIDKIYFLLHSALQYHYLSNYGASFSENFYDLKRITLQKLKNENRPFYLGSRAYFKSLSTLTLIPYIRHYLNKEYHKIIQEEGREQRSTDNKSLWVKLKEALLLIWPMIHFIQEMLTLVYYIRYLLGYQNVQTPLLHLSGVALARLSKDDVEYIQEKSENMMSFSKISTMWEFCRWSGETFGFCLQNSLEVGAFFLQFLDWFYNNSSSMKNQLFASSPIPPPPKPIESRDNLNTCPICFKERKQDTVLSVSGYVYCYSCILPYIRKHGCCPVTNYPATTKQLIKIYFE